MAKGKYSDCDIAWVYQASLNKGRQTLVESSYCHTPTNQDGDAESWAGAYLPPCIQ